MSEEKIEIFTIGHSNNSYEEFMRRLRVQGITAIADVRSSPFSRHQPHFNRDLLKSELRMDNIAYVFLGEELGGRPKGKQFYCDGVADYEKMASTDSFRMGLERVSEGATKYRIALMCSEHDPLDCHRCLLVGRALSERNFQVHNILGNDRVLSQKDIEARLLQMSGRSENDFFEADGDRLKKAYRERSLKVAYSERPSDQQSKSAVKEDAPYAS